MNDLHIFALFVDVWLLMRKVSELVAESPNLGFLAGFVEPGSPVPSQNNARELWKYLAARILPSIVASRGTAGPAVVREFKRVQMLALAAQIPDFSLKDYDDPVQDRWGTHMAHVAAFYEFVQTFRDRFEPEVAALNESSRNLELYKGSVAEARQRLTELEQSGLLTPEERRAELAREVSGLEAEQAREAEQLRAMQHALAHEFEPESENLQSRIHRLETQHVEHIEHVELVRPFLARGVRGLKPEVQHLQREVSELQRERSVQAELESKYALTSEVLAELQRELATLIALKRRVLGLKQQRKVAETTSNMHQRKELASQELQAKLTAVKRLQTQIAALERDVELERRQHSELLEQPDPETADGDDEESKADVDRARAHYTELLATKKTLVLNVKAQRKWLQNMERLRAAGTELQTQLDIVKNWMKLTLAKEAG